MTEPAKLGNEAVKVNLICVNKRKKEINDRLVRCGPSAASEFCPLHFRTNARSILDPLYGR